MSPAEAPVPRHARDKSCFLRIIESGICQRWMKGGRAINVSPERGLRFEDDDVTDDGNVADMTKSTKCAVFDMMSSLLFQRGTDNGG